MAKRCSESGIRTHFGKDECVGGMLCHNSRGLRRDFSDDPKGLEDGSEDVEM